MKKNFEKLEIGKTYKTQYGREVKIIHYNGNDNGEYKFIGNDAGAYCPNGSYIYKMKSPNRDLVELVDEPEAKLRFSTDGSTIILGNKPADWSVITPNVKSEKQPIMIRRFPSGAIRSDNRGRERYDFISPLALKELAQFLATTENAFASDNYFLGIPEEACMESLLRHVNDYRINKKKEEATAILFNAVALLHTILLKERGEYITKYDKTEYINKEDYGK